MLDTLLSFFGGSKIKLIFITLLVASALTAAASIQLYISSIKDDLVKTRAQVSKLEADNKILQANIDVMRQNMKTLADANQANLDTIQKLIEERSGAQQVIGNLANMTAKDKQTIASLNKRLNDLAKDPKNDGIVSPVLKETIRGVQQSRKQK